MVARAWRSPTLALAAVVALTGCGTASVDNAGLIADVQAGRADEVTVQGPVVATAPDSPGRRSAHERFTIDVGGLVVEVDHNLALAPRVPVRPGDTVIVHGQFEPDPGRPVIHYTHHRTGRHEGGWIELGGHRYQ